MPTPPLSTRDHQLILGVLSATGVATSTELQAVLKKSQPTISRLVSEMTNQVLTLGRARATVYGLPQSIRGQSAQQPIWQTDLDGVVRRVGTLSFLAADTVHVESDFGTFVTRGALPWPLAPLRAQGFLGRLLAHRLGPAGVSSDPEKWSIESILFGAIQLTDAPGALTLGNPPEMQAAHAQPELSGDLRADLESIAADISHALPAGSSAGGEQPKFLAVRKSDGQHVLVKFAAPRGTPFGDRWHDLLCCEDVAGKVLGEFGIAAADSSFIQSDKRTFLVSDRFDRLGRAGRRHIISVGDAHGAFVAGSYSGWRQTTEALARQRRIAHEAVQTVDTLHHFGRLIGNSDMHSGNLGLFVELQAKPRFALAPVYDMLPMRWRPDATRGGAPDYSAFEPDAIAMSSAAAPIALRFWERVEQHALVSTELRALAAEMALRVRPVEAQDASYDDSKDDAPDDAHEGAASHTIEGRPRGG